ncbi:P27 family phage terminase small subunit [Bradyrhizobium sp. UNPA324]|uniref:P27 family phage terminase small subunit n=1 Tax=Bradyrhizobium sp. UNPA324 TaxID=1141174 RepID=UPI0011534548|nr:P27 family phage terminase small subunit [Bradyrhizobium sp. UNPA324]
MAPPRKLGKHGAALWDKIQSEYRIGDAGGVEVLAQICAAVDRAEQLADEVARDGPMIMTKAGMREHPAMKAELACRAFVTRNLQRLGLNLETVKSPGRPPSGGLGWRGCD